MAELEEDDGPAAGTGGSATGGVGGGLGVGGRPRPSAANALGRPVPPLGPALAGTEPHSVGESGWAAAERFALEQEVMTLRRTLAGKERTLDSISVECRRLEDAIEDEHAEVEALRRDVEVLRQDLERKSAALATERRTAAELERDFHDLRVRLLKGDRSGVAGGKSSSPGRGVAGTALIFLAGFGVGLLVATAAGIGWFGLDLFRGGHPRSQVDAALPTVPPKGAAEAVRAQPSAAAQETVKAAAAEPTVLRTLRDRLSDGSLGPLMVALPGATFNMGSSALAGEPDERPEHQVRITGFFIGANEVTFAEYDQFARATGRRLPDDFGWGRGRRPVVDVSWVDAQAYALWLSRQTGHVYRLPSEAEWEYAARAGSQSSYWWGVNPEPGRAQCFDCGTTWDDGRSTAPVGSFEANPFGLNDTAGNALEWTADCYRPSYVGAPADGSAWDQQGCTARVARGGAFNKPAKSMRSAARAQFAPDARINMLGFRIARDE